MGNHRISTKQQGFFPTNQPKSTTNSSLQLVKLQIFTQARSQFLQLSKFLCPQRWFGWWWVGRRCCCCLGSNGKAKVGLYLKKCHVCIYYICRRKGIIISWFFSEEDGINKQNLKKKRKGQRPRTHLLGMISANFPPKWLETASDFFSGGYKLGFTKSIPCPPEWWEDDPPFRWLFFFFEFWVFQGRGFSYPTVPSTNNL